jgi:hypothetical protein
MNSKEFEKNYPYLFQAIKEMHACAGGGSPDFFINNEEWIMPENLVKMYRIAEKMVEDNMGVKFKDIWNCSNLNDKEEEELINEALVTEYMVFPEDGVWSLFLQDFPKWKIVDRALYLAFEGPVSSVVKFSHEERNKIISQLQKN